MNNYDEEIKFYENAIKTAIDLVEFKHFDSSKKEEFMKCLRVIKTGSIEQKKDASKSIYSLLKGIDNTKKRNLSSSYVENKLEKVEAKLGKLPFKDRKIIIDEIKSNPNVALEKYISEYVTYCKISEKEK